MNRATAGETAVFLRDLIELEHGRHSAYSKRHAEDGEENTHIPTIPQFDKHSPSRHSCSLTDEVVELGGLYAVSSMRGMWSEDGSGHRRVRCNAGGDFWFL